MSDTESNDAKSDIKGAEKFSPFAGCLIMIIVGLLVIGVIIFSWQSYEQVKSTVEGFTEVSPAEVELVDVSERAAEQSALDGKLASFRKAIEAKQTGELSLSAEDLNLAIASYDILEPSRQKISIRSISAEGVSAAISYPVNSALFSKEKRYLNGEASITPEITGGALFPTVKKVRTSHGNDIPEEFKKFISETMLHPIRNDESLGGLMKRISSVEIVGDRIVLKTEEDFVAAGELPDDNTPIINRFMKGFGIVALVFLFIVSLIIFISRRKAPNSI